MPYIYAFIYIYIYIYIYINNVVDTTYIRRNI